MHVHFVARYLDRLWPDLACLTAADVDAQADRFQGGVNNWVVQTYLHVRERLAQQGISTSIGERFMPNAVCVAHRDCLNNFFDSSFRSFVVGVRADRPPLHNCNITIVQNHLGLDGDDTVFMPFWPQPGLVPREPGRGSMIQKLAYMGRTGSMPHWYTEPTFLQALADEGVAFEIRETQWHDYSDVDLVLACRDEASNVLAHKPASKLVNAWLAGVPALLSPEPAFMRLRHDDDDFKIVHSGKDVIEAVRALKRCPIAYMRMLARAQQRRQYCDRERVIAAWMHLLTGRVQRDFTAWQHSRHNMAWCFCEHAARTAQQKLQAKAFRWRARVAMQAYRHA
jgi:hypothetical protein